MAVTIPDQLLNYVKRSLGITWTDEETDNNVKDLIADGMAYLNAKYGAPADFMSAGRPRTLLKEYVRYARDYALDVFENNYRSELLSMRNSKKVADYVEKTLQTCGRSDTEL